MKRLFNSILLICLALQVLAVPADPRLLQQLLEQGDTARYEQMISQSHIANSRRPKAGLRDKALQRVAQNGARKEFGVSPLLASKGLLILANFSDESFQASNTQAEMDSMMNAVNYTYNGATGSAAQYYSDQSLGAYRPHFDVVGPVTLPQKRAYYGTNDADGNDQKLGDLVLHACSLAAEIDGINLADYDQDGDDWVDFVYIIYAGKGEADGGAATTVWPASWDMPSAIYSGYTSLNPEDVYDTVQYSFDGVVIGSFAYSGELNGYSSVRNGIGTPTHEFGHVLGLPDLYDTYYGSNYSNNTTPGSWDIMDSGPYNNDGKTPPSMSPWEKAFMGWITPINPGNDSTQLTIYANGNANANVYQINASGTYQDYKTSGLCYLIENRQQTSKWDAYAPGHGLVIWKLNYNEDYWTANEPNSSSSSQGTPTQNTSGTVSYTVVSASGYITGIGSSSDSFRQGTNESWAAVKNKRLENIYESNGIITCDYNVKKSTPGSYTDCEDYSWTASEALNTGDNTLNDWTWGLTMTGSTTTGYESDRGAQFGGSSSSGGWGGSSSGATEVSLTTDAPAACMVETITIQAATSRSGSGDPQLEVYIGEEQVGISRTLGQSTGTYTFSNDDSLQGALTIRYTGNTSKKLFLKSVNISFAETPAPEPQPEALNDNHNDNHNYKKIENGQVVIIRENQMYDILGNKIQ